MGVLFRLIIVSPEYSIDHETELVSQLFDRGLDCFHLRKPDWNEKQLDDYIQSIPVRFYHRIVIHSHFQLASKYRLKGIHLNEEKKILIKAIELEFPSQKIISASFHSLEELEKNVYPFEYVFLGPVFDSISKPGYSSAFDRKLLLERFQLWNQEHRILPKVIALGGVNALNVSLTKELGFSGAALLGAVWESKDPLNEFPKIHSKISDLVN